MNKLAISGGNPVRTKAWPRWPQWGEREKECILDVLESGRWGGFNSVVKEFEDRFAYLHQAKHCISVVNGTISLEAALCVLGIGPGDEVIIPSYGDLSVANAVRLVGASPIFVDIQSEAYNLDVKKIEESITSRTKIILPIHFAGHCVDMDTLLSISHKYNLTVIEDAAHAHGSSWRGQPVGTLGHISMFSFQQGKSLTAGEGGALLTNDDELSRKLRSFANQGQLLKGNKYESWIVGCNLRMTGWQASILLAQLERFNEQLQRRQTNARYLNTILETLNGPLPLTWDERADNHTFHFYVIRYSATQFHNLPRNRFIEALCAEGIPCSSGYEQPLNKQHPRQDNFNRIFLCPKAEQACQEAIWLPQNVMLADLTDMEDIGKAIVKIKENVHELL